MLDTLTLWQRTSRLPLGSRVFSFLFAKKAPYFATVRPRFTLIEPHHAELVIRDRRGVHNHLGTVHAIALCNGLEAAMGALAEVSIPPGKRWIPQGMEVAYTAKATGDITCIAETDPGQWTGDDPDLPVRVRGVRADGTVVVEGQIRLWASTSHVPPSLRGGNRPAASAVRDVDVSRAIEPARGRPSCGDSVRGVDVSRASEPARGRLSCGERSGGRRGALIDSEEHNTGIHHVNEQLGYPRINGMPWLRRDWPDKAAGARRTLEPRCAPTRSAPTGAR